MPQSPVIAKRPVPRRGLWRAATIAVGDWQAAARVRNVSRLGALLESDQAPATDTLLTLGCEGVTVAARVMWRDDERFGIAFEAPLDPAQLRQLAGDGLTVAAPTAYRLGGVAPVQLRVVVG